MSLLRLEELAYESLINYLIKKLPVFSEMIAKHNFYVRSYTWFAKEFSDSESIDKLIRIQGNAFIYYLDTDDIYFIGYNNKCKSFFDLNWAIAHEIGHAAIQHLKKDDIVINKSIRTYEMEMEAEYFTYMFLCPDIVLDAIGVQKWYDICFSCCIPIEKAIEKEGLLHDSLSRIVHFGKRKKILTQFNNFIEEYNKLNNNPVDFRTEIAYELFPYELFA